MAAELQFLIILAVLSLVVRVVSTPLRRAQQPGGADPGPITAGATATRIEELEASREAKYREIRDADLDHRTGKLSDADYEELDRGLRGEALAILRELDRVRAE